MLPHPSQKMLTLLILLWTTLKFYSSVKFHFHSTVVSITVTMLYIECCRCNKPCLTLCDALGSSPPGSSVRGDSPGKNTREGCHALLQGSSRPRDGTRLSYVSCIGRHVLYHKCPLGSSTIIFKLYSKRNWITKIFKSLASDHTCSIRQN